MKLRLISTIKSHLSLALGAAGRLTLIHLSNIRKFAAGAIVARAYQLPISSRNPRRSFATSVGVSTVQLVLRFT